MKQEGLLTKDHGLYIGPCQRLCTKGCAPRTVHQGLCWAKLVAVVDISLLNRNISLIARLRRYDDTETVGSMVANSNVR